MAGDHKCPVCQSTFTRPQHVARHMRSHTGDRPYKCQHCGDQFARSDLLSRHINKCHAAEKPPTTTAPSRRKGTAAASRATTSKQACDQCVTSSLPCDGANPCTKCVQRKCRCTYVKFHRQTAPAGPGHPAPPAMPQTIPGRHSISLGAPRLPDEFLLAPPPGTMNLSALYAAGPAAHQYALQQQSLYPQDYASLPPLASALAPTDSLAGGMLSAQAREALENDPEALARYRAQAELMTRANILHNNGLAIAQPAPSADASAALPGLYAAAGAPDGQYSRYNLPPPSQWDPPLAQQQNAYQRQKEYESQYAARTQSHPSVSPPYATGGEPSLQSHPPAASVSSSYEGSAPTNYHHSTLPPATTLYPQQQQHPQASHSHHGHTRSEDLSGSGDDFGSDAGSTSSAPSQSIPSSANSSSVHLPLPGFNNLRTKADFGAKDGYEQPRYPSEQGQSGQSQSQNAHEGEGGFSSAFGLMSLDDPNVLAGLANDGAPFFSGLTPNASNNPTGLSLATPTQDLLAQLKSAGGREALESKEMRDFWKQYLRTPLTGPNAGGLMFPLQTPTGPGSQLGHAIATQGGRPSPSRRHSRVASLPSMKTPPLFADERLGSVYNRGPEHYDGHGQTQGQQGAGPSGVTGAYNSTVRTTLHGDAEDLKSYEQAVLARKAPMQLNLVPKRKGSTATTHPGSSQSNAMGKSKSMSPVVPHATYNASSSSNQGQDANASGGSKISELLNRPASSSSAGTNASSGSGMSLPSNASTTNSSLAHAFGGERPSTSDGVPNSQSPPQQLQDGYGAAAYRPSFKRIASQTLGPDNAKRALLGPAGWDHEEEDEDDVVAEEEEEDEEPARRMPMGAPDVRAGGYSEARRMSLPTQG